jgi:hypothetical protein
MSRIMRFIVAVTVCSALCFGLGLAGARTAHGSEKPDYSWVLRSPLKKYLSGATLSYLQRAYGSKKTEKHALPVRPIKAFLANEQDANSKLVNDVSSDIDDNSTQSETSLAVHGDRIVIAWNDAGDFFKNGQFTGYGYSHDGGKTFVDRGPVMPPLGGTNLGDPGVAVDKNGDFYISTLSVDRDFFSFVGVAKSTDGGVTFAPPVNASGTNLRDFPDKSLMAVDATDSLYSGNIYAVWTNFVFFGEFVQITFSRSTDGGRTFSAPIPLSAQLANPVQGAMIGVGPEGEVYVTWEDLRTPHSIRLRKSSDGGQTFGPELIVSTLTPIADTEASLECAQEALHGLIRVNDFPIIAVDRSNSAYRGTVYVTYNADPDGAEEGDVSDVFFVRSTDGGQSWTAPVRVNNDQTLNDQFFPFVSVGDDGTVSVMWYDRRLDPENLRIDLFRAVSNDGGQTFVNERVTSTSFGVPLLLPNFNPFVADCYMGDYNWMSAQGETFYLSWGDNRRIVKTPEFPEGRPDPDVAFIVAPTQVSNEPRLSAGPSKVQFGSVDVGESEERKIFIQNFGGSMLSGTIELPEAPFTVIEPEALSFNLAAGALLEILLAFNPEQDGSFSGTLRLRSNDPTQSAIEIALTGEGLTHVDGPGIRVEPAALNFGTVAAGQSKQLALTVRNIGNEPLIVRRVSSNRASLFRVVGFRGPQLIQPGRSFKVKINGRAGANARFKAKISVLSNDPDHPKVIVPVQIQGSRRRPAAPLSNLPALGQPQPAQVDLYTMAGRLIFSQPIDGESESGLSLSPLDGTEHGLPNGAYLALVHWRDSDGIQHQLVQRIIVSR